MTPVTHWNELEFWPNDRPPAVAALLELRGRVAALEAAAAPVPAPEPPTDDQRLAYLTSWLRGYIGSGALTAGGAEGLAREMLANQILAGAPAPMEWPELPEEPPNSCLSNYFPSDYREGRRIGWLDARRLLAEMNPSRHQEDRNDG